MELSQYHTFFNWLPDDLQKQIEQQYSNANDFVNATIETFESIIGRNMITVHNNHCDKPELPYCELDLTLKFGQLNENKLGVVLTFHEIQSQYETNKQIIRQLIEWNNKSDQFKTENELLQKMVAPLLIKEIVKLDNYMFDVIS